MLGGSMTLSLSLFGNYVQFKEVCMSAKLTSSGLVMISFMCLLDQDMVPVIQSNTNLSVIVRYFVDVIKVHNQLTLSKENEQVSLSQSV